MKKSLLLTAFVAVIGIATAYAQPRAIGLNLGPWSSISYQHGFGDSNMLDVAANIILPINSGLGVGGHVTYDWIDPFGATVPWNEQGEWHWYMGVGGSGGFNFGTGNNDSWWYAGVAGHIGIEYDFWFPLQLSVDWRPSIGLAGKNGIDFNYGGLWGGLGIGVRYLF